MRIAVGVKIRNEKDIVEPFLRHLDSLFDIVYIFDHKSKDGTGEILKEAVSKRTNWEYIYVNVNGHFHKQVSNAIMKKAFADGADFLFMLDADEFVDVRSRSELEMLMNQLNEANMPGTMSWKNCIPVSFDSRKFTQDTEIWVPSDRSSYRKVVVSKKVYEKNRGMYISQGNHWLYHHGKKVNSVDIGTILHVPIRSRDQAEKKVLIKCISYIAIKNRSAVHGFHNFRMLEKIAQNDLDVNTLRGFSFLYEKEEAIISLSDDDLLTRNYKKTRMSEMGIPFSDKLKFSKIAIPDSSNHVIADALMNWKEEDPENSEFVIENSVMVLRPRNDKKNKDSLKKSMKMRLQILFKKVTRKVPLKIKREYSKGHYLRCGFMVLFGIGKIFLPKSVIRAIKNNIGLGRVIDRLVGRSNTNQSNKNVWTYKYLSNPFRKMAIEDLYLKTKRVNVDIVVCVHNALMDFTKCIESLIPTVKTGDRIIIVDDQSDEETQLYIMRIASEHPGLINVIRTKEQSYYTKSANIGLRTSKANFVIFLNSDTVVSKNWIEKVAYIAYLDPTIGIVGPLSNAANLQSIPSIARSSDNTAINEIPAGMKVEDMNARCEDWSKEFDIPIVPFVHGFCLCVKRDVVDKIGLFDEENFSRGFGEETDYCLRALDAGFNSAIAINTYVFHAKSRSYNADIRKELMRSTYGVLAKKHSLSRLQLVHDVIKDNPVLIKMRIVSSLIFS